MMTDIALKCDCGKVEGVASDITPDAGTRIVCYCDDCQKFAQYLSSKNEIINENGGTDIFQVSPAQFKITAGVDQIRCVRLTPKGLYRWYTQCCETPIGNTMGAGVPFIGVVHNFMNDEGARENNLGPVRGHILTKFAKQPFPDNIKQTVFPLGLILRTIFKVSVWKIKGASKSTVLFNVDGSPISSPKILGK